MANTNRIYDIEKVVHGNKVKADFIAAPFTQIKGEDGQPRRIPDLANNLKASVGVERVPITSIRANQKEFGPSGQEAFEIQNKDSRIRFVGDCFNAGVGEGSFVQFEPESFVEVTFYGTGLNILPNLISVNRDIRASVDGGAEGSNILPSGVSNVLINRNYSKNQIVNVVSGLSLGIHTVKLRAYTVASALYGIEILNESSQLVVNPGQPFVGGKTAELTAQQLLDLSPAAIVGAKGGRVKTYIDEEGNLGQTVTEVDATALYLGSADHSNEEIVRKINWFEFGKNRADDFSDVTNSSVNNVSAFTLDDGTTTLVASDPRSDGFDGTSFRIDGDGNGSGYATLTFVGTGLSVRMTAQDNAPADTNVSVDDSPVGALTLTGLNEPKTIGICSGLPYGTHTVRFDQVSAGENIHLSDFIIYQPKEPVLPENVMEIADYNVMADFADGDGDSRGVYSTGMLFKNCTREFVYTGTWNQSSISNVITGNYPSGHGIQSDSASAGATLEYTFWGTGFEWHFTNAGTGTYTLEIDGALYTGAALAGLTNTWTPGTSTVTINNAGLLRVNGLSLGKHTIKFTKTSTAGNFAISLGMAIITPIHINDSSLKVGNLSLADLRNDPEIANVASSKVDLSKAKAWVYFDGITNEVLSSYNISAILDIGTGVYLIYFKQPFKTRKYVSIGTSEVSGSSSILFINDASKEKNYVRVDNINHNATQVDRKFSIVFFGELENEEDIDLGDL